MKASGASGPLLLRRRLLLAGLLVAALGLPGRARAVPPLEDPPDCRPAIAAAERAEKLPRGLLGAMGRVETGQAGPDGRVQPWPWAVNANGQGALHPSRDAAIRHVKALQRRGFRRIDAGCLQVNLMYHPQAFGSLEEAFSPEANARYAARFLRQLHGSSGGWMQAVALYHSARPERGLAYRSRVEQALNGRDAAESPRRGVRQPVAEARGAKAAPVPRTARRGAAATRPNRQPPAARAATRQAPRQAATRGARGRQATAQHPARQSSTGGTSLRSGTRQAAAGPARREARRPAAPARPQAQAAPVASGRALRLARR